MKVITGIDSDFADIGALLSPEGSFSSISCLERECPPPLKLTRSTSHGVILLTSDEDSSFSSNSSPVTDNRRICWLDSTSGLKLARFLPFHKDDEAWRCSKHGHGPLLTRVGSPTAEPLLNATLPASTSELMRKVIGGAGVALEDVHIAGNSAYLFGCFLVSFPRFSHRTYLSP